MTTPNIPDQVAKIFDFRINLVAILALGGMLFGAAAGVSKFETIANHEADFRALGDMYVHKDVNAVTDRELREWMMRLEVKLNQIQRDAAEDRIKGPNSRLR